MVVHVDLTSMVSVVIVVIVVMAEEEEMRGKFG